MKLLKPKKLLSTNREALRWCRSRQATINYDVKGDFVVTLGTKKKKQTASTLIQAVNLWIKYFNKPGYMKDE